MVERDLAKVEVASSSLVSRSSFERIMETVTRLIKPTPFFDNNDGVLLEYRCYARNSGTVYYLPSCLNSFQFIPIRLNGAFPIEYLCQSL